MSFPLCHVRVACGNSAKRTEIPQRNKTPDAQCRLTNSLLTFPALPGNVPSVFSGEVAEWSKAALC